LSHKVKSAKADAKNSKKLKKNKLTGKELLGAETEYV